MRTIELRYNGKVYRTMVDDEDYDYLIQWKWQYNENGYVRREKRIGQRRLNKRLYTHMHKEVYIRHCGELLDNEQVDHIDCNKLNNTSENLRKCLFAENQRNKKKNVSIGSTSKYKGVSKYLNKWRATINLNNKQIHLGVFANEEDAAKVYNEASKIYHKEFGKINCEVDGSCISDIFYSKRKNASKFSGVSMFKCRNGDIKWRARVTICGKRISIGLYDTEDSAKDAIEVFKNEIK